MGGKFTDKNYSGHSACIGGIYLVKERVYVLCVYVLANTENSCYESAGSHLSDMYRKIPYKILKEYSYLFIHTSLKV